MNYRDMAATFGVSISTISNDIKVIIKRLHSAQATNYACVLELELRRIDTARNAIWSKIQAGNLGAITKLVHLQNQRLKFLGLRSDTKMPTGKTNILPTLEVVELIKQKRWNHVIEPAIGTVKAEDTTGSQIRRKVKILAYAHP